MLFFIDMSMFVQRRNGMRFLFMLLMVSVLAFYGCEAPEETKPSPKETSAQTASEQVDAAVRVSYRIDARGRVLEKLQGCVKNELGAMNDVAPVREGGHWEIRMVARDSRDFRIFSESLISISTLLLQPAEAGQDQAGQSLYQVRDHKVTTFPSDDLGSACEDIMEDVAEFVVPEGD